MIRNVHFWEQAEDIRSAVEYLRSRGKTVSVIAGHSKAGSGVLCYAAKYKDIPKVVNISGRLDQKTGACMIESERAVYCAY